MINNLEVREMKLDYAKIISLAFNKEGWGKEYTLYTSGKLSVNITLHSWNFIRNEGQFNVIIKPCLTKWDYSSVMYYANNMSIDDLKIWINKTIKNAITNFVNSKYKPEAQKKYYDLLKEDDDITNEIIEEYGKLDDFELAEDLSNEYSDLIKQEIKDSILLDLNQEYNLKVKKYIEVNTLNNNEIQNLLEKLK